MPEDYAEVREAVGGFDTWLYNYEWAAMYYSGGGHPSESISIQQVYGDWTLRADHPRSVYTYTHFVDWCSANRFNPTTEPNDTRQLSQHIDAWRLHTRLYGSGAGLLERCAFGGWLSAVVARTIWDYGGDDVRDSILVSYALVVEPALCLGDHNGGAGRQVNVPPTPVQGGGGPPRGDDGTAGAGIRYRFANTGFSSLDWQFPTNAYSSADEVRARYSSSLEVSIAQMQKAREEELKLKPNLAVRYRSGVFCVIDRDEREKFMQEVGHMNRWWYPEGGNNKLAYEPTTLQPTDPYKRGWGVYWAAGKAGFNVEPSPNLTDRCDERVIANTSSELQAQILAPSAFLAIERTKFLASMQKKGR